MRGSSDEVFDDFCSYKTSFQRVRAWPIQLCSEYYTALAKEFVDQMLTRGFKIPLLLNMNTKLRFLLALKEVIEFSSTNYKAL